MEMHENNEDHIVKCYPIPWDGYSKISIDDIAKISLAGIREVKFLKTECHSVDPTHLYDPKNCMDLCFLNNLHEAPLLSLLRQRFFSRPADIYTYTGDVLISINPYYQIKGLYGNDTIDKYLRRQYAGMDIDQYYGLERPAANASQKNPHVYKIAADALEQLLVISPQSSEPTGRNQSIIISGESGAGKTEASKHVIDFLLRANSEAIDQLDSSSSSTSERQAVDINAVLVKAGVILEAFGNAKTVRNDNSSRFGKYIKLLYTRCSSANTSNCMRLTAAQTETFLLEKSRVVAVGEDERNYHIFYEMVQGLQGHDPALFAALRLGPADGEKAASPGQGHGHNGQIPFPHGSARQQNRTSGKTDAVASRFRILSQGHCTTVTTPQADSAGFSNTLQALQSLSMSPEDIRNLWTLLACILHLGNLTCQESDSNSGSSPANIQSSSISLDELAALLGLQKLHLIQSLTTQKLIIGDRHSIKTKVTQK